MTQAPRMSKRARRFLWIASILLLCAAGFLTSKYVSGVRAKEDLAAALDLIRQSGQPVQIEDLLDHVEYGDPNTGPWLRSFDGMDALSGEWNLSHDEKLGYRVGWEKYEALTGYREREPNWDELMIADSPAAQSFWWNPGVIGGYFSELPELSELQEIELAAFAVLAQAKGEAFESALRISGFGPIDKRGALERLLAEAEQGPHFDIQEGGNRTGYFCAVQSLSFGAVLAVLEGRQEQAKDLLILAFKAAQLNDSPVNSLENLVSISGMSIALYALNICLTYFPQSTDLTPIEQYLSSWRPIENHAVSLSRERAFGNSLFRYLRAVGSTADRSFEFSLKERAVPFLWSRHLDLDQLRYLKFMDLMIAESEKPLFDSSKSLDALIDHELESSGSVVTMFVLIGDGYLGAAFQVEVKRRFALCLLEARRNGIEAGLEALQQHVDPFSGQAYRSRIEDDGCLVLWSVDEDGVDDGALRSDEDGLYKDIVWRYRPGMAGSEESK